MFGAAAVFLASLGSSQAAGSFLQRGGGSENTTGLGAAAASNLQAWADKQREKGLPATLVVMGDSTMILMSVAVRQLFAQYEVHSGERWFPRDAADILTSASCPHTLDGVQTTVFGPPLDLTMHRIGLHSRLEDDQGCFDDCLVNAVQVLRPGAVVWNFGLHLMHLYPLRSCVQKPETTNYHNCGSYGGLVAKSAEALMKVSPTLVWRTTNHICEEMYNGPTRALIEQWHDRDQAAELERQCQEECQFEEGRACADELEDTRGSQLQYEASLEAVRGVSKDILVLDAYAMTAKKCRLTHDGQHYQPLSMQEVISLAAMLVKAQ